MQVPIRGMLVEAARGVKGKPTIHSGLSSPRVPGQKAGREGLISIKPWLFRPNILIRARQRVSSRLVIFAAGEKQ